MQRGKWQRKKYDERLTPPPELAVVADATGQTYRVSLQELVAGYSVLLLYGKDNRLICHKPQLGRGKKRKETLALADIRRVIMPKVELPARVS